MQVERRQIIFSGFYATRLLTDQGGQIYDEVLVLPVFYGGVNGARPSEPTACVARPTQRSPIGRAGAVASLIQEQSRPWYVASLFLLSSYTTHLMLTLFPSASFSALRPKTGGPAHGRRSRTAFASAYMHPGALGLAYGS